MDELKLEYSNLVRFVKPHTEKESKNCETSSSITFDTLDGRDVFKFYTDLVSTKTQTSVARNRNRTAADKKCLTNTCTKTCSTVTKKDLFRSAQYGDTKMVKKCVDHGMDIDSWDSFGWTSLMCAACGGNADVVQILLESAADTSITDSTGRDVKSIAIQSGHQHIADQITNFQRITAKQGKSGKKSASLSSSSRAASGKRTSWQQTSAGPTGTPSSTDSRAYNQQNKYEGFFCVVCKTEVKESSKSKHDTSTVHLFNLKLKPKADTFLAHSTNKGYQLMLKSGWDGQKGLGPKGEGQKYPVKTVLKRDRKCLGAEVSEKSKAKVTHYGPRDVCAVQPMKKMTERKMTARTMSKRAQKAQDHKKRNWERNLRSEFNCDFTLN